MTFEEDFPSLKGKEWWVQEMDEGHHTREFEGMTSIAPRKDEGVLYDKLDVRECCVDKQRLEEAIEELKDSIEYDWTASRFYNELEKLLEELGLDD